MGYQYLPTQQANLQVPASAMAGQLDRGAGLTKQVRDEMLARQKMDELRKYREALLAWQKEKYAQEKELAEEQGDESFWSNIIGGIGGMIPGIGPIISALKK